MSGKIIHAFFEISMSNGHDGLGRVLTKQKQTIGKGEFALFINRDWTACKLLTSEGVLLHLRRPRNQPIDPKAIPYLPYCITGTKINYSAALGAVLKKEYSYLGNV